MEFRFNLDVYFKAPIVKVTNTLLPSGFYGDRRAALDATSRIAEIINDMGEASAKAQGLSKPVTTAQKLRNSDHIVYLMAEKSGKNGVVTGLLKIGTKSLYVFDHDGETHMVNAPCVLDFYVHETRQRAGLGKVLFQYMLDQEHFRPERMAIDRPSEKLLGFLRKHYKLEQTIPQMNNFVVYEGFFSNNDNTYLNTTADETKLHLTSSPNTLLFGPQFKANDLNRQNNKSPLSTTSSIGNMQNTPVGRYAAPRPLCSMAEIIHNSPSAVPSEPKSTNHSNRDFEIKSEPETEPKESEISDHHNDHEIINITTKMENFDLQSDDKKNYDHDDYQQNVHKHNHVLIRTKNLPSPMPDPHEEIVKQPVYQRPTHFQYSKQHTGLKNISYNVGMAVTPTNKMEFDQEGPESFGVVKINRPIGKYSKLSPSDSYHDAASVISSGSGGSHLTEQGFLDLKFYHNKLW